MFLRKPKKILLYDDPQKHHLKAFFSHLQGLALLSQMVMFICKCIFSCLFIVHNIISLSRDEQVCLVWLH